MPTSKSTIQKSPAPAVQNEFWAAGLRLLAQNTPVAKLTAKNVAAEAGLRPAQFNATFATHDIYLLGLLRRLSDEVRAESVQTIALRAPSRTLIREGITAYLDSVFSRPALLEISSSLRAHPECQAITRDRMNSLATLATLHLKMNGASHAEGLGRLGMAMLFEITHAEREAGTPLPDFRHTFDAYFGGA